MRDGHANEATFIVGNAWLHDLRARLLALPREWRCTIKALLGLTAAFLCAAACGVSEPTSPGNDLPAIARVDPAGQSTGVDPAAPIVIEFTHPMMAGMERYIALHQGATTAGPVVAGRWTWSSDRRVITFDGDAVLRRAMQYTIHIGGGLRDSMNRELDHGACGAQGGENASPGMMGGSGMMGDGWRHSNGSYGMLFTFTTA